MLWLFFFLSFSAMAASDSTNAFEKSYPRDNTYCALTGKRIEFIIRGGSKYTEPKERGFGELLFYRNQQKKPKLLDLNISGSDTFAFFKGKSTLCSKSHGYKLDDSTFAVLLRKENRPFNDLLVLQLFDVPTLTPKEVIATQYPVEKILPSTDGFMFQTVPETHNPDFGKVMIEGNQYIYQERDFPIWMSYSLKGFEVISEMTFSKFPWKKSFLDLNDFLTATGYNTLEKKFTKTITYLAVNHKLKKRCLLIIEKKQKLVGNESWRCHAI